MKKLFVLLLLNIKVNSYGHVGTVTSAFVGLLTDIELNDTQSPAIKYRPVNSYGLYTRTVQHTTYPGQAQLTSYQVLSQHYENMPM